MKIWEPKSPGTLWATPGLFGDSITFYVRKFKAYNTIIIIIIIIITEYINILYRSIDILDMMFSDRLSNIRMD